MSFIIAKRRKESKHLINFGFSISLISRTAFVSFLFWFFIFLGLEHFKTGIISNYFDLQILLILAIISGIIALFSADVKVKKEYLSKSWVLVLFGLILGCWWLFVTSGDWRSILLVAFTAWLIILTILNFKEDGNKN